MKIIKQVAKDIECNIAEAKDKIETAYKLRSEFPTESLWYRDMAAAHLNFNNKGHELVSMEIEKFRSSAEYEERIDYVKSMMDVWNDKHAELVAEAARVKAMIDSFK